MTTFHDLFSLTSDFSSAEFRQRFSDFARQAAARSDLIIAVSRFTAGEVERLLGIPESRIRVVPHGVNLPASVSENREPIVLFTGAVQVRKNVARLARAFRALGPRWRLVIAGSPTGFGAEAILTELQALPGVDVRGYVSAEELKDLYRRASIFAFPSLGEGFGIPVLEAMAHGVPVITSKSTALEEIGNGAALLVNPASEDEIAHALTTLAANEDLRQSLIEAGLQRAREYPWQRTVAETYSVYRELF